MFTVILVVSFLAFTVSASAGLGGGRLEQWQLATGQVRAVGQILRHLPAGEANEVMTDHREPRWTRWWGDGGVIL